MLIMPSRGDRVYELLFIFCCNCVAIFARFPRYSKVLVQIGDFFINPFYVTPPGKTVANISALFFLSQPSQIPGLSCGVNRFCKVLFFCLLTAYARYRQTDGRNCDLNSGVLMICGLSNRAVANDLG